MAIAFKIEEYTLHAEQAIDLDDLAGLYSRAKSFVQGNQALLCLLEHKPSRQKIVVGTAHFDWSPDRDYVKFAQANFLIDKTAEFMRVHQESGATLPLVLSGDFNSFPVSSVLSAFYGEDIEDESTATWTMEEDWKPKKK